MKENEIKVSDEMLAEYWFKSALDSLEVIKKTILFLNQTYNFNLYDDDEDLTPEKLNLKVNAKYTNVCTPLAYVAELFLKSIIISDAYLNDNDNFKRNDAVRQLMKDVKSQFKSNAHNLTALVEYINKNIDDNFKIDLAQVYLEYREHRSSSSKIMYPLPRIEYATNIYENAFINSRYLCETNDTMAKHIDLVKLVDYVNTLRDCCFFQLLKIKLSKDEVIKKYITEYYSSISTDNDNFLTSERIIDIIEKLFTYIVEKIIQENDQQHTDSLSANDNKTNTDYFLNISRYCEDFYKTIDGDVDHKLEEKITGKSGVNILVEMLKIQEISDKYYKTKQKGK